MRNVRLILSLPFVVGMCSCGDSFGTGDVRLEVSGGKAATHGYPVEVNGFELKFADGWELDFERALISFGNIFVEDEGGERAIDDERTFVVELTSGAVIVSTYTQLPAKRWEALGFDAVAPTAGFETLGGAGEDAAATMLENGWNFWLMGDAHKNDLQVSFDWAFAAPVGNRRCINGTDNTPGMVIQNNAVTEESLDFHLDHLFWNALGLEAVEMRFDAIAAAAVDGLVSFEDLASQDLNDLRGLDGGPLVDEMGIPVVYNKGSVGIAEDNLREFIRVSAASMMHLNDGLCEAIGL